MVLTLCQTQLALYIHYLLEFLQLPVGAGFILSIYSQD